MLIACLISRAINTHLKYVILIVFKMQQWLQVRASMIRYTCIAFLVMLQFRPVFWLHTTTHLHFSALLDDRKLNSKTLMRSPIRCHSTVYQNQRNNVCTYYGCLYFNHRIKRRLIEHVRWYYQPRCQRYEYITRVQLKCDGTRWRTGGEVKGKLANGVGSQYSSHYLGTWCIQHYYRWCANLGCQ